MFLSYLWEYDRLRLALMFVSVLIVALTINWFAIQRSRSPWAVLWGVIVVAISGVVDYATIARHPCSPTNWEFCGMEDLQVMINFIGLAIPYLVLALLMFAAYRQVVWRNSAARFSGAQVGMIAMLLPIAALSGQVIVALMSMGILVPWQRLEIPATVSVPVWMPANKASLPPGAIEKAQRILLAHYDGVVIETDQKRIISAGAKWGDPARTLQSFTWGMVEEQSLPEQGRYEADCGLTLFALPPPGQTIDRRRVINCNSWGLSQADYAILSDGSLWAWRSGLQFPDFLYPAIGLGSFIGFLIGLILAMRWEIRLGRNQNDQ